MANKESEKRSKDWEKSQEPREVVNEPKVEETSKTAPGRKEQGKEENPDPKAGEQAGTDVRHPETHPGPRTNPQGPEVQPYADPTHQQNDLAIPEKNPEIQREIDAGNERKTKPQVTLPWSIRTRGSHRRVSEFLARVEQEFTHGFDKGENMDLVKVMLSRVREDVKRLQLFPHEALDLSVEIKEDRALRANYDRVAVALPPGAKSVEDMEKIEEEAAKRTPEDLKKMEEDDRRKRYEQAHEQARRDVRPYPP